MIVWPLSSDSTLFADVSILVRRSLDKDPIKIFIFTDTIRDTLFDELVFTTVNTSDLIHLKAFIETSKVALRRHLNEEILKTLRSLYDSESPFSAVLFKNIPVDPFVPPTPTDGSSSLAKPTYIAEAMLVGLGELSGAKVVGYGSETRYSNPWVHEGFPQKKLGSALTTTSDLSFHQDMSYHHHAPDILGLVCVREGHDRHVFTELIDNRDVFEILPRAILDVLQEPLFQIKTSEWVDSSWTGAVRDPRPLVQNGTSIHLPVDWENMVGLDNDAEHAVELLKKAIDDAPKHHVHFVPGDLLLFSNLRMIHARTPYNDVRFDGGDRVLNRAYFLKDVSVEDQLTRIIN